MDVSPKFYNGLGASTRTLVSAALGGAFMGNTQDEAFGLFEDMAMNNYQWQSKRILPRKVAGLHDTDAITAFTAQVASLTRQLQSSQLTANAIYTSPSSCGFCQGACASE